MKHMEILRRKLVYELFIEQFLEMAKVSVKYRSLRQSMCLLKQTERICLLLRDDKFNGEADKYQKLVDELKESVESLLQKSTQGPELPRRESLADKAALKIRNRLEKCENNYTSVDGPVKFEEASSDDDNDEIYNYHHSVMAQIHATSAENLARFQHTDDGDDEVEQVSKSFNKLESSFTSENSDYESDSATKL
jgi:hypothetical protein